MLRLIDNNVEMLNLMCIFDHTDRTDLIDDIAASMPYIDDAEMYELMAQTVDALEEMSDEEFAQLVFEPARDEDDEWEDQI